jgi:molybdate transport system ATP-binding protein
LSLVSLYEYQVKLDNHFVTPPFTITFDTPGVYVLAGRNGSGKSLLLSAIAGQGKVVQGQRDCYTTIAEVSVFQQQALITQEKQKDSADILDVIAKPTSVRELFAATNCTFEAHPLYAELLRILRLESLLDNGFLSLSTGETRKVIIMMAWLSNASLILLDEPFEGLDAQAVDEFSQFLTRQSQASLLITANKLTDIPRKINATLLIMDQLAIKSRSNNVLSSDEIMQELSTWFALHNEDIALPAPLAESKQSLLCGEELIVLKNGFVRFDDHTVFEHLDFTLKAHQHWQIEGPNGSGKTCLLQMFTGDNAHCYTNDLTMFGIKRGTGESIWDIKKHIGIMSNALHMQYKVNASLEHVILSGFYDSIGLYSTPSAQERAAAEQWLAVLGFSEKKNAPFQSLSFGDQRLILIARSMVKHPAILILDEPCNGLDEFNRVKTRKLIEKIVNEGKSTVLYVTHSHDEKIPGIDNTLSLTKYKG